jgi:hypothetical protein
MRAALPVAILSVLACASAHAYEVETGAVMLCDTQKQVERFVQLFDGNRDAAMNAVNAEESNPTACAVVNVAYVQGDALGTARTRSDAFRVVPVLVVGMQTPAGFQQVEPSRFFTVVKVKEYAV